VIIGVVAKLVKHFVKWAKNNEELQEKLKVIWEKIQEFIGIAVELIGDIVERVFGWIQGFIDEHGETIMAIFNAVWDAIKTVFETVTNIVLGIVERVFGWIQGFIDEHGETIMKIFGFV
jgi:phage-related protein